MNICISGLHGTGKSSVAKLIANKYKLKYYSTGFMFRELAKEKELTLEQMSKKAEEDRNIDFELDNKIKEYVKKGNCIVDNQLSPYLLGNIVDLCVLLKCTKDIRMKRMAERDDTDINRKIKETLFREESEHKRFIKYYNVDLLDGNIILRTFDLIIDTTKLDINGCFNLISTYIEEIKRGNT
ncbi:MAG: (d)CMP kinase [Promethearchaeota archaeon]